MASNADVLPGWKTNVIKEKGEIQGKWKRRGARLHVIIDILGPMLCGTCLPYMSNKMLTVPVGYRYYPAEKSTKYGQDKKSPDPGQGQLDNSLAQDHQQILTF